MNNNWIILSTILCLVSCNEPKENIKEKKNVSINQPNRSIERIKKDVYDGNVRAYGELKNIYLDSNPGDFLYWALFMANRHDYPKAYLDVFYCIVESYVGEVENFDKMDKRTKELALQYLTLASERGVQEASEILLQVKNK